MKRFPVRKFSLLWLLVFVLPMCSAAQSPRGALLASQVAAVDRAVRAEMERQQIVGAAIGIIEDGQIVYLNGYGWADGEKKIPVGPQTLFRWASISKTLTAVTAMQLVEKNQLDLDADVRACVPEFPVKDAAISARHLLCHQSGIPHYANGRIVRTQRNYPVEHPFEDVVLALDTFKESPLLFAPGEKFSYSTYAYILLSAVVQRAGKEKFADQVQQRIIKPLGLTTLQPDYQWNQIPNRAMGYAKRGDEIVASTDTDVSWKLGGGGYVSNIEDLALFAQSLIGHRLLREETYNSIWQPQKTSSGELTRWGLGFSVEIGARGRLKVWHDGQQEKSTCRMVLYPKERHGIVVMCNGDYIEPIKLSTVIYGALNQQ